MPFGSYLRVLCIFALWPLYLYVFTNRTRHRGADRGPGVPGGSGVLRRTNKFTPIYFFDSHSHHMFRSATLYFLLSEKLHGPFYIPTLDHLLRQYMVRRLWVCTVWDIVLVYELLMKEMVDRWCRGDEQCNSISDRGLGACVGHALRDLSRVREFPVWGRILRGPR